MTGFDGLVEARSKQISDIVRRSHSRVLPGSGKADRETTLGQKLLAGVGTGEEVLVKAVGSLFTNDDKYNFSNGIGQYHTQVGFADLFRSGGFGPVTSAMLGIAAAIANPLDPVNKLKILQPTKLGVAAKAVTTNADNLFKDADDIWRISAKAIDEKIAAQTKAIKGGELPSEVVKLAENSIANLKASRAQVGELNELLTELQKRGVNIRELRYGGSVYEQVLKGQRHLFGFSDFRNLGHIPGMGSQVKEASVYGFGGKGSAALIKSLSTAKNAVITPLKDYAYKVADYIGIPTLKTEAAKKVGTLLKTITDKQTAQDINAENTLLAVLKQFMKEYGVGEEAAAAARLDLRTIVQGVEFKHDGIKEMLLSKIEKLPPGQLDPVKHGLGVEEARGRGLTPEQKMRLAPSGVDDADIPVAIGQFEQANVGSIRIGQHKQHEVKVFGRYVVVKTNDPRAVVEPSELNEIFGNRAWARHEKDGQTFLVQKRHPSAQRITKTSDFEPTHLKNLESIAAQLSVKKKGFTALKPEDVLVSPSGAVQIINPTAIIEYKSAKDAIRGSRIVLDSLADDLAVPHGSLREFPLLRNTKTARAVPRGVDGLTFRTVASSDTSEGIYHVSAYDLLEQSANTVGHREIVRGAYGELTDVEHMGKALEERLVDMERTNNIEFHRQQIRQAVAQGLQPNIEPISLVVDDLGALYVANGRDRLTAAILEGFEGVPVYQRNFVGDVAKLEAGFYAGKTVTLRSLWSKADDSSASNILESTNGIAAGNYALVSRGGAATKLTDAEVVVDSDFGKVLGKLLTVGPQFKGKAALQRLESVSSLLTAAFGSLRNAYIRISELAESASDVATFTKQLEAILINPATKQGIQLDNVLRHVKAEDLFIELKNASTRTLDELAKNGVLTTTTVKDTRRILLASEEQGVVVKLLDEQSNALKIYSNDETALSLKRVAENHINRTVTAADVEPYARIELNGVDDIVKLEARDLVTGPHPLLTEVMEPVKVFSISKEHKELLKKEGILVSDDKNVTSIAKELEKQGIKTQKGLVLLREEKRTVKSDRTGKFYPGRPTESVIVRPEFAFFVTRSGSLVLGLKHRNVNDLLNVIFEEGPRYVQEFGIMTTGKIVISNPLGSAMKKFGAGEIAQLQDRLKDLAKQFSDLGLTSDHVLKVHVPFDDAVWRSIYGEHTTIGAILDPSWKLKIPDNLKGFEPDLLLLAPRRLGGEPMGVVGLEKTRLANANMQKLVDFIEQTGDRLFIEQAKAGLPISYHTSWLGRHLTKAAKEALNDAALKYPDKESKTFKHFEAAFKARVLTDLTTQEINEVIKRFQKLGIDADPSVIISDVVRQYRKGYELKPTVETAASLVALSKILPEGIDFFEVDPIYSLALSARDASRAMSRKEIVDSLKEMNVAVWHGTPKELDQIRIGKAKEFSALEKEAKELQTQLDKTVVNYEKLAQATPDISQQTRHAELKQEIDRLTYKLADVQSKKVNFIGRQGNKVLDTMVDTESEHVWIRGEDVQDLVNRGVLQSADVMGDAADALVRIPIKKYASALDGNKTEIFLFPKEVAGAVQRYFHTTTREGFDKILQLWDTAQSAWRNWTLFPVPAYHVRNFISNLFMAYLGGVTDPQVYDQAHGILQIVNGHRKGTLSVKEVQEALGTITIASADGKLYTGQQVYDAFLSLGGLSGGLHKNEFTAFGTLARASDFERETAKIGLRPSSELAGTWLFDNPAIRGGVSAASFIENRFRFATFIDALQKGHVETANGVVVSGFEAAALQMKKVFYDYSDLSAFERSVLRRVFPFYSWSRHNIPRMLTTLVTEPIKHYRLAQFFNEIETGVNDGHPIDENSLPEWIREKYGIVVSKTKNGNYTVKTGDGFFPMNDAFKAMSAKGIGNMIMDGFTPFFKVPIEQVLNYSVYTGRPLEQIPGERAASYTLGQIGFSRKATTEGPLGILNLVMNESMFRTFFRPGGELATKVLDPILDGKEGPSLKLYISGIVIGKAYEIDPAQTRRAIFKDWTARQNKLVRLHHEAKKQGDFAAAEDAARMLTWLRLQHPGEKEL